MNRFGSLFRPLMWFMALLLAAFVAGCGSGGGGGAVPAGPGLTAGGVCAGADCVPLGAAGNFVILARSGISTVPASAVTGDIGVSPASQTAITGFSETADASNTFSTSTQVTGKIYAADYLPPTPDNLTTAVANMITAYNAAAGRAAGTTDVPAGGDIGGLDLPPGVYKWNSGVAISTNVTLTGSATDVWIFQIGGNLTQAAATTVTLAGGALSKNIFWQVSGNVALGTTANFKGVILAATDINLLTGASIDGRLISGTAVNLDANTVTQP